MAASVMLVIGEQKELIDKVVKKAAELVAGNEVRGNYIFRLWILCVVDPLVGPSNWSCD